MNKSTINAMKKVTAGMISFCLAATCMTVSAKADWETGSEFAETTETQAWDDLAEPAAEPVPAEQPAVPEAGASAEGEPGNVVSGEVPTTYKGVSEVVLPAAEKDGFLFVGWNTEEDGSGMMFYPGELFVLEEGENNLFGVWEEADADMDPETEEDKAEDSDMEEKVPVGIMTDRPELIRFTNNEGEEISEACADESGCITVYILAAGEEELPGRLTFTAGSYDEESGFAADESAEPVSIELGEDGRAVIEAGDSACVMISVADEPEETEEESGEPEDDSEAEEAEAADEAEDADEADESDEADEETARLLYCRTDSESKAMLIAELYGIEFVSYEDGVAAYTTDRDFGEVLAYGAETGLIELKTEYPAAEAEEPAAEDGQSEKAVEDAAEDTAEDAAEDAAEAKAEDAQPEEEEISAEAEPEAELPSEEDAEDEPYGDVFEAAEEEEEPFAEAQPEEVFAEFTEEFTEEPVWAAEDEFRPEEPEADGYVIDDEFLSQMMYLAQNEPDRYAEILESLTDAEYSAFLALSETLIMDDYAEPDWNSEEVPEEPVWGDIGTAGENIWGEEFTDAEPAPQEYDYVLEMYDMDLGNMTDDDLVFTLQDMYYNHNEMYMDIMENMTDEQYLRYSMLLELYTAENRFGEVIEIVPYSVNELGGYITGDEIVLHMDGDGFVEIPETLMLLVRHRDLTETYAYPEDENIETEVNEYNEVVFRYTDKLDHVTECVVLTDKSIGHEKPAQDGSFLVLNENAPESGAPAQEQASGPAAFEYENVTQWAEEPETAESGFRFLG